MLKPRSAVIVVLPIPRALEAIRRDRVPVAGLGVPSHVTILSPFLPADELQPSVRSQLVGIAAGLPEFDVTFDHVERFPDALYLAPYPHEPFRELSIAIVRAFPGYPPYGDPTYRPEDGVPHLTIAMANGAPFSELAAAARPHVPFTRKARFLTVIEERPVGQWKLRWRVPLRRGPRP